MFKKEKEMEKTAEVEKTREVGKTRETDTSSLASRSSSAAKANRSVIGEQISIEGTIQGKGDLLVEGVVKGNIEVDSHHLTIGLKGNVESEIHATDVTISGKLKGDVHAKGKVAITKEAIFSGEINAKSISVEDGAVFQHQDGGFFHGYVPNGPSWWGGGGNRGARYRRDEELRLHPTLPFRQVPFPRLRYNRCRQRALCEC